MKPDNRMLWLEWIQHDISQELCGGGMVGTLRWLWLVVWWEFCGLELYYCGNSFVVTLLVYSRA